MLRECIDGDHGIKASIEPGLEPRVRPHNSLRTP